MKSGGNKKPSDEMSFASIVITMVGLALICTGFGIHYDPIIENQIQNVILALTIAIVGGVTVYSVMKYNDFGD